MIQVVKAENNHWYVIKEYAYPEIGDKYLYNENNNSRGPAWKVCECKDIEEIRGAGTFYDGRHHIWCHKILRDLGTEKEQKGHEFRNEEHVIETMYSKLTKRYSIRLNGKVVQSSKVFGIHMSQLQSYLNTYKGTGGFGFQ